MVEIMGQIFYNTAEACKIAGTNRDSFLRWVRDGKFTDVEMRDRNGWRLFTNEDIERLKKKANRIDKSVTTGELA